MVRGGSGGLVVAGLCAHAGTLEVGAASVSVEASFQCGGVVYAAITELESAEGGTDTPVRNPNSNGTSANSSKTNSETETFTPDQTFAYDAAGNRKEITRDGMTTIYQANAANQYAQIATGTEVVEPVYDELGYLLEDDRNTNTWDADIHLMSVTGK